MAKQREIAEIGGAEKLDYTGSLTVTQMNFPEASQASRYLQVDWALNPGSKESEVIDFSKAAFTITPIANAREKDGPKFGQSQRIVSSWPDSKIGTVTLVQHITSRITALTEVQEPGAYYVLFRSEAHTGQFKRLGTFIYVNVSC